MNGDESTSHSDRPATTRSSSTLLVWTRWPRQRGCVLRSKRRRPLLLHDPRIDARPGHRLRFDPCFTRSGVGERNRTSAPACHPGGQIHLRQSGLRRGTRSAASDVPGRWPRSDSHNLSSLAAVSTVDWIQAVGTIATTIGLTVGATWGYLKFRKRGEHRTRVLHKLDIRFVGRRGSGS
jgi:hypothetical protein